MKAQLKEIVSYLKNQLQPELFSDYCTNGLQIEGKPIVKKICTAVSVNLHVIKQTVQQQADLLLVHHGLFWQKDSYDIHGSLREKLKLLLSHDISLIGYHLPLDAHQTLGNNWKAAKDLGWKNLKPFPSYEKQAIGVQGTFPKQSRKQFLDSLEKYYKKTLEVVSGGEEFVTSVALVSGGGHKMIFDAIKEGLQCYVTGTRDEPIWYQSFENNINFYAVGHYTSEIIGVKALGEELAKQFGIKAIWLEEPNLF